MVKKPQKVPKFNNNNKTYPHCLTPPTMGCHPMLTKNTNFVTNALRGDLSTINVRN